MKRCLINYDEIEEDKSYSKRGLRSLSPGLLTLKPLEYSAEEQRREAISRAGKMSLQGVQLKLSAKLKVKEEHFEVVDQYGHYILKPQHAHYPELPENEALTMTLAVAFGIDVPVHGLVYSKDKSLTYFVKRFDRFGHNKKLALEDFAQLLQLRRDTKYESSMEQIAKVIYQFCTFPKVEAQRLLKRVLFNFLTGNADMHVKNFSLITQDQKIMLSPAYDLLNTTIAANEEEELALLLNGRKKNIRRKDFMQYYALERLQLNQTVVDSTLNEIKKVLPKWRQLIVSSFLSDEMKQKYLLLLEERCARLGLVG